MKPSEIKALREANTIKEVVAMVDCREAAHIQHHLMLQYSNRILDGMPEAAALNQFKESKMYSKAQEVEQAYDAAQYENCSSEGCYALAIAAAHEFGGVEIYNSNDGNGSKSFAPSRTFVFDDGSSAYIMCGGVYVIEPSA